VRVRYKNVASKWVIHKPNWLLTAEAKVYKQDKDCSSHIDVLIGHIPIHAHRWTLGLVGPLEGLSFFTVAA